MSHDHHHHHAHEVQESDVGAFRVAFFLNLVFTVVELIGGLFTNSVAILSDAVHDLGDSISLLFSLAMERIAGRRRTPKQTFGYKRYSVLGAIVSAAVLLVGSIFVMMEAVPRLFAPETVHPEGMLPLAVAGIAFNLLAVLRLRGGGGKVPRRELPPLFLPCRDRRGSEPERARGAQGRHQIDARGVGHPPCDARVRERSRRLRRV